MGLDPVVQNLLLVVVGALASYWFTKIDKQNDQRFNAAVEIGALKQRQESLEKAIEAQDKALSKTQDDHATSIKEIASMKGEMIHVRESIDKLGTQFSDFWNRIVDAASRASTAGGTLLSASPFAAAFAATGPANMPPPAPETTSVAPKTRRASTSKTAAAARKTPAKKTAAKASPRAKRRA